MNRLASYLDYHSESAKIGDIDPSYNMLKYVCDRFELNVEQRYWLAFVYALTYCGASTFYVYNEFPDFENLDTGRLDRWWKERGRDEIICQTDRRWVRSLNLFVPSTESYRDWIHRDSKNQSAHFQHLSESLSTPEEKYEKIYAEAERNLHGFGQFSLFLYLEALHTITPLFLAPTNLDLNQATSCRNGLCYAYDLDHWLTEANKPTPEGAYKDIDYAWVDLREKLKSFQPNPTIWQTETMLCAYKKFHHKKRYIGYYLDRQAIEIRKMEASCPRGVAWEVLWQFRAENCNKHYRAEDTNSVTKKGVSRDWKMKNIAKTSDVVGESSFELTARITL